MKTITSYSIILTGSIALLFASCQHNLLTTEPVPAITKVSSGENTDWLHDSRVAYGSSMDVETVTYRTQINYGNNPSKSLVDVAASPRLYRQRIESRVLMDGSLELNTMQLKPNHLNKLPEGQRDWEELGPHSSVVSNNRVAWFDTKGKQIAERNLKPVNYSAQLEAMRRLKQQGMGSARVAASELAYPTVDPRLIRNAMAENPANVKTISKYVLQIRQTKPEENANQYTLTTFDTYYNRVLESEVRDITDNSLLQRTVCRYQGKHEAMQLIGIYTERLVTDSKTNLRAKEVSYQYIQNAKFVNNL